MKSNKLNKVTFDFIFNFLWLDFIKNLLLKHHLDNTKVLLTLFGTKPRSYRPILGPKSLLMGISRRDGTGFCRGCSKLMMLLASARVASVEPPARGSRLGRPPPGPAPCQGETPLRPKFLFRSLRLKSMRRPPLCWGLRFAILELRIVQCLWL